MFSLLQEEYFWLKKIFIIISTINNKETVFKKRLLSDGAINIAHKAVKMTRDITPGFIKT